MKIELIEEELEYRNSPGTGGDVIIQAGTGTGGGSGGDIKISTGP